ncbi:MAG: GAF domain-containing protein [Clostridiales bacterium]|jgi:GAF domain-containing protein|nr:GAF domain-containing protein [Clostridiales bacterium]
MDYDLTYKQAITMLHDEANLTIASLANISSFIYYQFKNLNWVGFYLFDGQKLVLGPFCGKVACTTINLNKGVCGKALHQNNTIVVADVHKFDGHIACDSQSNSEIVVPIYIDDSPIGVLDIDSPIFDRFCNDDKVFFENLVNVIKNICGKNIANIFYQNKI